MFDLLLSTDGIRLSSISPSSLSGEPAARANRSLIPEESAVVDKEVLFKKCSKKDICDDGRSRTTNKNKSNGI